MIDESKLIFFTGAPGCKWSATSHIITHNSKYPINTSDYSENRVYTHSDIDISHYGAYWGPGNGIGENFHKLSKMSKEEIIEEIDKPYLDKSWEKYRIIKCHHFSLNLNFIKETFPKSKILIVLRPDFLCFKGWLSAGGFEGITYPNYTKYYKNKEILDQKIQEENAAARDFIHKYNLDLNVVREKYWKEWWGIKPSTPELERYIRSIESRQDKKGARFNYDVLIADYNFKE
jgi:hypothetical protein